MPRAPVWKEKQLEYLQRCSDRMLAPGTIRTYQAHLDYMFKFAQERDWPLNPAKLEPSHARELKDHLALEGFASGTMQLRLLIFLDFSKFCGNRHMDDVRFRIKVSRRHVDWLTELEVSRLIRAADSPQERAVIVIMAFTGMRRGEVLDLRTKDIKPDQVTIRGKGDKERKIGLDSVFWDAMRPYMEWTAKNGQGKYFVAHGPGEPRQYSSRGIYMMVKRVSARAGVPVSPHTLRRSFGRHLYKRGCPVAELSRLMGHSSLEMTMRYLGIGDEDINHAITFRPDYLGGE